MPIFVNLGGSWHEIPEGSTFLGGTRHTLSQVYVNAGGVFHPIWGVIHYPLSPDKYFSGFYPSDSLGHITAGQTLRFARFPLKRKRTIVGIRIETVIYGDPELVKIRFNVGSTEYYGANVYWVWHPRGYAARWPRPTVQSPWIPCYLEPQHELRVFAGCIDIRIGHGGRKPGMYCEYIKIIDIRFN